MCLQECSSNGAVDVVNSTVAVLASVAGVLNYIVTKLVKYES